MSWELGGSEKASGASLWNGRWGWRRTCFARAGKWKSSLPPMYYWRLVGFQLAVVGVAQLIWASQVWGAWPSGQSYSGAGAGRTWPCRDRASYPKLFAATRCRVCDSALGTGVIVALGEWGWPFTLTAKLGPHAPYYWRNSKSQIFRRLNEKTVIVPTPILKAELVVIDDDIIRYRVWCDQCSDWHYH